MTDLPLVLSLVSVILTIITSIFSFMAYCRVVGMEKSTHQVQWMPVATPEEQKQMAENPTGPDLEKEFMEKMYPDMDKEFV